MSLVSSNTITNFTGLLYQHFNQFKREITVCKEGIKTYSNINSSNTLYGYGEESNSANFTITPVSGVFYGRIRHDGEKGNFKEDPVRELNIRIPRNGCIIKVEEDCKNYIQNGKTEMIIADSKHFNVVSDVATQNYLGLKLYLFTLEGTT